ncbi:hypothetical protein CXG81DRAFT_20411 [Caulochytrium protostelioides]|uniref:Uncharacterized protein n=1 Tax=Caulochytrium protostelioides TaxID=1555241 RepID=A0A4P9X397_9FUNG|nr:hypothetical protein CXG81DRAFT_20411 [Caulochytrium protostelioides]|eukprot:RKO99497.1 hypothetical protein CXG81DRAFT_20411 [Caulochytrium protostelioides]
MSARRVSRGAAEMPATAWATGRADGGRSGPTSGHTSGAVSRKNSIQLRDRMQQLSAICLESQSAVRALQTRAESLKQALEAITQAADAPATGPHAAVDGGGAAQAGPAAPRADAAAAAAAASTSASARDAAVAADARVDALTRENALLNQVVQQYEATLEVVMRKFREQSADIGRHKQALARHMHAMSAESADAMAAMGHANAVLQAQLDHAVATIRRAVALEDDEGRAVADFAQLQTENAQLRRMLALAREYGSPVAPPTSPPVDPSATPWTASPATAITALATASRPTGPLPAAIDAPSRASFMPASPLPSSDPPPWPAAVTSAPSLRGTPLLNHGGGSDPTRGGSGDESPSSGADGAPAVPAVTSVPEVRSPADRDEPVPA